MAVQTGWVGTSAKEETGKAWMSEARLELQLSKAGWMSEMIGKSTEIIFINTENLIQASIYDLMGSPTESGNYIFDNSATISAGGGTFALRTGEFPVGSTLTIINRGYIRGRGGAANNYPAAPSAGGNALHVDFPCTIDNTGGAIYGGGGGGAWRETTYHGSWGFHSWGSGQSGGGGGAGTNAGAGGRSTSSTYIIVARHGAGGSASAGGAGGIVYHQDGAGHTYGGAGGGLGAAGGVGRGAAYARTRNGAVGAAGKAINKSGHAVTVIATGDIRGAVS